jgi:CHAT domain-containing protein
MGLGHIHSKLGEKQRALNLFDEARELLRPTGVKMAEASLLNNIGQAYSQMGQFEKALSYQGQALHIYQGLGTRNSEGITLEVIAQSHYLKGEYQKALDNLERARSIFKILGDQWSESGVIGETGKIYEALGDRTKALDYYNMSLSLKRSTGRRREQANTLNTIGRMYHGMHDYQKAFDYYAQALPLSRATGDRYGECSTLYNTARLERDRGNLLAARSTLETSLGVVESLRAQVASQELRASYFASVRQHYDLHIDLLMQMHKQRAAEGLDAAALQASERGRARSLLESIAEARTDIRQGVDPDLLERERSLQKMLTAKTDRRMRLLGGKPNEAEATVLAREIKDLTTQFDELQAQIRSKSPRYASLTQPQPLNLGEIQQQVLDEKTLLLEYALGDERSYLWAITPTDITSYELPGSAEIERAARRVYELLVARQPKPLETPKQHSLRVKQAEAEYWQQATALSQVLLGPAVAKLGAKRLLIVAEGALQYLPFGALPVPQPNPAAPVDPVPLIVEHEIVSLPSISVLAGLRSETLKRKMASKEVVVLADPVFETDDPRLLDVRASGKKANAANRSTQTRGIMNPARDLNGTLRDVGSSRGGLSVSRLIFSSREAEAIMEVVPQGTGLKAEGFKASRQLALSPDLGQYKIVHFATHGQLDSEHPELSGIVLSMVDEQGRPQNGFLGLRDIYNLNLPVELVVLSACSTALGKDVKGEGLVGIVRGFMYAGAARVVASLWKVDDEATAALMKQFYRRMFQEGMPAAAALRAAQIEMWRQKEWRSPYFWAAFVLQGEWK